MLPPVRLVGICAVAEGALEKTAKYITREDGETLFFILKTTTYVGQGRNWSWIQLRSANRAHTWRHTPEFSRTPFR